mmetsp:Transcript_84640/g.273566  ORF Transcript_84640/g.273566 Transcript_84640/m.273566 type:complete len:1413 (-) Transcript_84640:163-4401(-)
MAPGAHAVRMAGGCRASAAAPARQFGAVRLGAVAAVLLALLPMVAEGDVNVALGKPCEPEPLCPSLIDGNEGSARRPRLRGQQRRSAGRGRSGGRAAELPNATVLSVYGSRNSLTFKVFLDEPAFVTRVIIHSSLAQGGNSSTGGSRWRKLVVTWADDSDPTPASGAGGSSSSSSLFGGSRSSSGDGLLGDGGAVGGARSELTVLSADPMLHSLGVPFEYVLQVGHKASSIAIEWGAVVREEAYDGGDDECSNLSLECDELQVTNVQVMALTEDPADQGDSRTWTLPVGAQPQSLLEVPPPRLGGGPHLLLTDGNWESNNVEDADVAVGGDGQNSQAPHSNSSRRIMSKAVGENPFNETLFSTTIAAHVPELETAAVIAKPIIAGIIMKSRSAAAEMGIGSTRSQYGSGSTKFPTTLAPDMPLAEFGSEVVSEYESSFNLDAGSGKFLARTTPSLPAASSSASFMTGLPVLLCLGMLVAVAFILPRVSFVGCKAPDRPYIRLPDEDTESLLEAMETFDEQQRSRQPRSGGSSHGGGGMVDPLVPSSMVSTPDNSRSSSPELQHAQPRSPSETEPEGEPGHSSGASACGDLEVGGGRVRADANTRTSVAVADASEQCQSSTAGCGRLTMLFASPLCHLDAQRGPIPMVPLPFEREWGTLMQAYNEAAAALKDDVRTSSSELGLQRQPAVSLSAQLLTAGSLQRSLAPITSGGSTTVLHLSAHGTSDCLVLEEPDRPLTAHLLSCDMLRDMLELRDRMTSQQFAGLKLVVLNACGAKKLGSQFVQGGIPHVVCSNAMLHDSAGQAFLRVFYGSLFQGSTVAAAFDAALVALRGDADAVIRTSAEQFCLLPEGSFKHDEVLFVPVERPSTSTMSAADEPRPLLGRWRRKAAGSGIVSSGVTSADVIGQVTTAPRDSDVEAGSSGGGGLGGLGGGGRRSFACRRSRPTPRCREQKVLRRHKGHIGAMSLPGLSYSPFLRIVPSLPDDFCGRALDTWNILQYLSQRRAVVLCSQEGQERGIGKSVVLDAVCRAFALQADGICVTVRVASPGPPTNAADLFCTWIAEVQAAVKRTIRECRDLYWPRGMDDLRPVAGVRCARSRLPNKFDAVKQAMCRGRAISRGFHSLSSPAAAAIALSDLQSDLAELAELCAARRREWPAASDRILLLLDECDHLIQQQYFQDAIADLLQSCSAYRIVLSTHQRMVGTAGGRFKVIHHALDRLGRRDAARLVMRRAQRPLRWEELLPPDVVSSGGHDQAQAVVQAAMAAVGATQFSSKVVLTRANEAEVFDAVGSHPIVAELCGNPRRLIELASKVNPGLASLWDLVEHPPTQEVEERRIRAGSGSSMLAEAAGSSRRASPAFTAGPMCASSSDAAATSAPSSSSSSSLAFASADRVVPQPARREEGSHAETEPLLP